MELEEMQAVWAQMTRQLEAQKKLTDKIIMDMTQQRYMNKIGIIAKYEGMGAAICFALAILLLIHFPELNTWYLIGCGIFSLAFLFFIPAYVLHTIREMKQINIHASDYKNLIREYTKARNQFLYAQRIGISLGFIFAFVSCPVLVKILDGKDIFLTNLNFLLWYFLFMVIFMFFFSRWGYGCYKNITASAGQTLKELDDPTS